MSVTEELADDDVGVRSHQLHILAVETILEPVQRLSAVVAFVNARRHVPEYVNLTATTNEQSNPIESNFYIRNAAPAFVKN